MKVISNSDARSGRLVELCVPASHPRCCQVPPRPSAGVLVRSEVVIIKVASFPRVPFYSGLILSFPTLTLQDRSRLSVSLVATGGAAIKLQRNRTTRLRLVTNLGWLKNEVRWL